MSEALTATRIRGLLAGHGIMPSKALGQHFLADPNTAGRIVRLAGVAPGDRVLEIGPGVGSLTVELVDAGAEVVALELDRHLLPVLRDALGPASSVRIEQGDALAVDLESLAAPGPTQVVANLPYNVAAGVVVRLLEAAPAVDRMLVMVQAEVGERLAARPGTRECGAVSAVVAWHAEASVAGRVARTVFFPPPNVDSVLLRLRRLESPPVAVGDPTAMFDLVRAGFAQRRKTLGRALRPLLGDRAPDVLRAAGIDPRERAERLGLEQWASLADAA